MSVAALGQMRNAEPSPYDLFVRPRIDDIGSGTQDEVNVVTQFRMETDFNAEQPGQEFLEVANPLATILVVLSGQRILPAKKRSPHAARPAVIDANFTDTNNVRTRASRHGRLL